MAVAKSYVVVRVTMFRLNFSKTSGLKDFDLGQNQLAPRCERVNTHGRVFPLREVLTEKLRRAMQL